MYGCALGILASNVTLTRGIASVSCLGHVIERTAEERANDLDATPATFVLEFNALKALGVHKFDKISANGKTYVVQDARVCYHGANPVVFKGACAA
jgi:hypothetical protein